MKNIYILLLLAISVNIYSQSGNWSQLNTFTSKDLWAGHFLTPNTGFAVSDSGKLFTTNDGGESWELQLLPTTYTLTKIKFNVSQELGLIATSAGNVFKSTDNGNTWIKKTSPVGTGLFDISFINSLTAIIVGNNGTILKTTDAGETWVVKTSNTTELLKSVSFNNNLVGIACGNNGTVLKSTDAGETWNAVSTSTTNHLTSVSLINETGYICGASGSLLKSTDIGNTWNQCILPIALVGTNMNELFFLNEQHGFITANSKIFETLDGASSFLQSGTTNITPKNITFYDENFGYTFGGDGSVYKFIGNYVWSNWVGTKVSTSSALKNIFFPSFQIGYAVGMDGTIVKTTNSGTTWEVKSTGGASILEGVYFTNNQIGYVCGSLGLIAKTTNGGDNWFTVYNGTNEGFQSIKFLDNNIGIAVANNGLILRTSDAGTTWNAITSGTTAYLKEISIYNSIMYVTGEQGKTLKSTDLGLTWTTLNSTWDSYEAICVTSENTIYLGGSYGRIKKSSLDSLNNLVWTTQLSNSNYWIRSIVFTDSLNGYAIFDDMNNAGGYIAKTTDAGNNWNITKFDNLRSGFGMFFTDSRTGFISSDNGYIFKTYFGGTPVELTDFSSNIINSCVELSWTTATETNNNGFNIERSTNKNSDWQTIGFVSGNGTSTEIHNYKFSDNLTIEGTYYYRLKQIDHDGSFTYSEVIEVSLGSVNSFELSQNYPNPFNPTTTIKYSIAEKSNVTLKVFDILGREITTLVNSELSAGNYNIQFDASSLASGVYIYSIKAGNFSSSKKMLLVR